MYFYPSDFKEKLEFTKIIDLLKVDTYSLSTKTYFDELEVQTDPEIIDRLLTETQEYKQCIEEGESLPIGPFESTVADLPLLRKNGYVLSIDAIQRLYRIIHMGVEVHAFFLPKEKTAAYPHLAAISAHIAIDPALTKEIDRVIDDEGQIRPDASPELLRISRLIRSKERELDRLFATLITRNKASGYLADTLESLRNGRRVLTVAAEHKRKIPGIIHDESATGKTVYIEPAEAQQINNEIFNLFAERKQEVYRILKKLCDSIRPYADEIHDIETVLTKLDAVRVKARLAIVLDASKPKVRPRPHFGFKKAYNPILKLKNDQENKVTVPFDLELHGQNRIIVISGPNAGGKSITMKSVGVLQLMMQAGMLVPVDPDSEMGIFTKFFADIGDQQSIEDDLSTYSSRLKNMRNFIESADKQSLILIDEFGSGTDPKMGGAIAEAILRSLNFQKCYGVITTHYSNIKYFAFKTRGVLNGSMEFDRASISPTYVLKVGSPGSSFAFEIAEKSGLDKQVLKYAKHKTGKNEKAIDELLVDLQSERLEVQAKMEKLMAKEAKLDRLMSNYEELHKELKFRRQKLKLEQKEQKLAQVDQENRALQQVVKELRKAKDLEKAQAELARRKAKKTKVIHDVADLKEAVFYADTFDVADLKVGGFAKMRTGDTIGEITDIRKGKAELQMGIMKVTVPLTELIPANQPIRTNRHRSTNTQLAQSNSAFDSKLDVRGYTVNDALDFVQEFVDQALINNIHDLKIIHGVGTGALKKAIHRKLREYKDIDRIYHPDEEHGGQGVTYIAF